MKTVAWLVAWGCFAVLAAGRLGRPDGALLAAAVAVVLAAATLIHRSRKPAISAAAPVLAIATIAAYLLVPADPESPVAGLPGISGVATALAVVLLVGDRPNLPVGRWLRAYAFPLALTSALIAFILTAPAALQRLDTDLATTWEAQGPYGALWPAIPLMAAAAALAAAASLLRRSRKPSPSGRQAE